MINEILNKLECSVKNQITFQRAKKKKSDLN